MPAVQETVEQVKKIDVDQYKYGFETQIATVKAPKGLSEDIVRFISEKKREPVELQPGRRVLKGFGCGVFLPHFFKLIEEWRPRLTGEVDEVPVLQTLAQEGKLLGVELVGRGFDAGNPEGFRAATAFAAGRA